MIPANQPVPLQAGKAALLTGEIEQEGAKAVAAKGTVVKGAGTGAGAPPIAKTAIKAKEIEAAEGAKAMAAKGSAIKGATAKTVTMQAGTATGQNVLVGKNAALIGKNAAMTGKPAAKGVLVAATKSVTATTGMGVSLSAWGPVLLAGILIASGAGIYYYLKKQGIKGELEEVST
ncbi:MAG: hypothetical protein H7839_17975 [Magnetococcus sp. YQC-5]